MRQNTDYGPIWIFPDSLPPKIAKHVARLELLWPDVKGFDAAHIGPTKGGCWLVRAPKQALEKAGFEKIDSAAEYPVAEGTVWPPIHLTQPIHTIRGVDVRYR